MMLLLPPIFYASTFYRFKYFFSWLKKRHPQVLADLPHRINKNKRLPILIIFKNSNYYPTTVLNMEVFINKNKSFQKDINIEIKQDYWEAIEYIDISQFKDGNHTIDVKISYKTKNKIYHCYNDNYRSTSHSAFNCYFSAEDLPLLSGFASGDMHSHSSFTDDQIEFGASINAANIMAQAIGLSLFCITDHSYDLDDEESNFLKNNPKLPKWKRFLETVKSQNLNGPSLIIPGEEVSVKNKRGETVHQLIYNSSTFFKGSGDSGEKWFHYYSENSINDVINKLPSGSISYAAHPADKIPFVHRLLLNRGQWHFNDAANDNLTGVQIFNGRGLEHLKNAISFWSELLLNGYKLFALAGNDSHGNFGKNKSVYIPFLKIRETETQLFGKWRTDIFIGKNKLTVEHVINILKSGNYSLSNGPCLNFQLKDKNNNSCTMGGSISNPVSGQLNFISNKEFGLLNKLIIFFGNINKKSEIIYLTKEYSENIFSGSFYFNIENMKEIGYFRAEFQTRGPKGSHFSFSNPIWVTIQN